MQTVQEWQKAGSTDKPQQSGGIQTVDQWLKTSSSVQPPQQSGIKSVKDWLATQPTPTPAPVVQAEKTQSFTDKIKTGTIDYANESADTLRAFPDKVLHPVRSFINFADTMKSEWMAGVTKAGTPIQDGNVVTDISNLITGVAQSIFSPVTALFKAADAIPGLKQAADAVNVPFMALGLGGGWVAEKMVNVIPDDLVSPETKEVIMDPLKELGGLTAQILIGGKIMDKLGDLGKTKKKGEKITTEEAKAIVEQAKAELAPELVKPKEAPVPQKAMSVQEWIEAGKPKTTQSDSIQQTKASGQSFDEWVTSKGLDPNSILVKDKTNFIVENQAGKEALLTELPIDAFGKPEFTTLNQSKYTRGRKITDPIEATLKNGELTITDGANRFTQAVVNGDKTIPVIIDNLDGLPLSRSIKQIKVEVAPEKLNSRVYERMKNENPELTGDVKYTPMTIKEDVQRASNLLIKDKQEAFDVAMGKKSSPDVTSTSVNIVMAEKALQDGNIDLFNRLTKKRSLDQTRRGQEIVSERASVSDNSVSRYVRDLIDTRLSLLGNSYLGKAVEFVRKQSPKQKATKIIDNEVAKITTKINSKKLDVKTALDLLDKLKCI